MKVAQYEVLGNDAKRDVRPGSGRDDRNVWLLVSLTPFTSEGADLDRPIRDGSLIKTLTQHSVLGYFHWVPSGRLLLAHISSRYVDVHGLKPGLRSVSPSGHWRFVALRRLNSRPQSPTDAPGYYAFRNPITFSLES
jgi:hypothetical protein